MGSDRRNPRSVDIDLFPTERILRIINAEDASVAGIVANAIPAITRAVDLAVETIRGDGRVFAVGAGTSGRIAVLDAVECPPTFDTAPDCWQAVIAGGMKAFGQATEGAEDDRERAAADLKARKVSGRDMVIGISASGQTPYTHAALEYARTKSARTVALVSSAASPMAGAADVVIETVVGPEVIAGSTRLKAGTAQKLVLNMLSTATMIKLGKTYSNWMINVSMTNSKLSERGAQILREILGVNAAEARKLSEASGGKLNVAVVMGALQCSRREAEQKLAASDNNLRKVLGYLGNGRE
jgi:N-acetylmuramic acid 6-phosphate etherase